MRYEIVENYLKIEKGNDVSLQFNKMRWGSNPAKYDLRNWEGDTPLKGVTINEGEVKQLLETLLKMYGLNLEKKIESKESKNDQNTICVLDFRTFLVRDNFYECEKQGHEYEKVNAVVYLYKNGVEIEEYISARYCKNCKAYYISEPAYQNIVAKGKLLCQVFTRKSYEKYIKDDKCGNLSQEHILHAAGYTVGREENYSTDYRRKILQYVIESGLLEKKNIINHLSFLIKLNEKKIECEDAVKKWRADRNYLMGYVEGTVKLVGIKTIIK